jgi:hypothetical protein
MDAVDVHARTMTAVSKASPSVRAADIVLAAMRVKARRS